MTSLKKKRVKREVKAFIKGKVEETLSDKLDTIKGMLLDNFSSFNTYLEGSDSKINLNYYYDILESRLNDFDFIKSTTNSMKLVLPDMDNFNFEDLEFIEIILEGLVGTYAEASLYEVLELLGNEHGLKPINALASPNEHIYLILVTDWLVLREKEILGYSLVRTPFSNTEPLYDKLFGSVLEFVDKNIELWINNSIDEGMEQIKQTYGVL